MELYCEECDEVTNWVRKHGTPDVWECERQCPEIKSGICHAEYELLAKREVVEPAKIHRMAFSEHDGFMIFMPMTHDDCEKCEDASHFYIRQDGFHCGVCGEISLEVPGFKLAGQV